VTAFFQVLPEDFGIRPAGPPDECFYCRRKVGYYHTEDCVVIVRDVTYGVFRNGRRMGTWVHDEPFSSDKECCEFQRNESLWCADNVTDFGRYEGDPLPEIEDGCLCGKVRFVVEKMGEHAYRASDEARAATRSAAPTDRIEGGERSA
jgi:hypothetical protein